MKTFLLFILTSIFAVCSYAQGISYVSNLANGWGLGGIGDIQPLFPGGLPYGTDTAYFTTGAGYYSVNSITLEFDGYPDTQWLTLQLFQHTATTDSLLGSFGNAVPDPRPTQWPYSASHEYYTTFMDLLSLQPIMLNPITEYYFVVSVPANSPISQALLFTKSSDYREQGGWTMGPTVTGDPYAAGEYIVMAVQATQIPEPGTVALLIMGLIGTN